MANLVFDEVERAWYYRGIKVPESLVHLHNSDPATLVRIAFDSIMLQHAQFLMKKHLEVE